MQRNLILAMVVAALGMLSACASSPDTQQPLVQYPSCDTDAQCSSHGEVCFSGKCVQCRTKSDCAKVCDRCSAQYVCRPILSCCTKDNDCGALRCGKKFGAATGTCK
jgi:hypothetical protein